MPLKGHAGFARVPVPFASVAVLSPGRELRIQTEVAQRLSPGEAFFHSVPEADVVLPDVPAEQDVLTCAA
jgi:hypothetical protein